MGFPLNQLDVELDSLCEPLDGSTNIPSTEHEIETVTPSASRAGRQKPTARRTTQGSRKQNQVSQSSRRKLNRLPKFAKPVQPKRAARSNNNDSIIVLGIDLGTTHSGVSYRSNIDSPGNQIQTISNFPDSNKIGPNLQKTRTIIAYADENQDYGPNGGKLSHDCIGYEVEPGMISHTGFKLRLDDKADLSKYDDPLLRSTNGEPTTLLSPNKSATEVSADYLRQIYAVSYKEITKKLTRRVFERSKLQIMATVPAIWDDKALRNTRNAFEQAGFVGRNVELGFISEPEAAAIAALKEFIDRGSFDLEENMTFVLLDLGGGTLDAECLRIKRVNPLDLEVVGVGEGAKCGSTAIDRAFLQYMKLTYGEVFEAIPLVKKAAGSSFMNAFERDKRAFTGNLEKIHRIPFPALAKGLREDEECPKNFDPEDGEVIITGADMMKFFGNAVAQTCGLVHRQVTKLHQQGIDPTGIILVGGLSSSDYVYSKVKHFCKKSFGNSIEVLRPDNAWSATSQGAVEYGLRKTVLISKVARRHYCTPVLEAFEEGKDPEGRAVTDPIFGKRIEVLQVLLRKGEVLKHGQETKPKPFGISIINPSPEALCYSYKILCSDADEPPRFEDDPGVSKSHDLKIDLRPVSRKPDNKWWNNDTTKRGKNPIKKDLRLKISGGSSAGEMRIVASMDGLREDGREWLSSVKAGHGLTLDMLGAASEVWKANTTRRSSRSSNLRASTLSLASSEPETWSPALSYSDSGMSSMLHNENGLSHLTEYLHLSQLYLSLEQLVYIQVAVLYYQDNSFLNLILRWLLSTNFVPPTAAALHRVPVILAFNALIILIHLFSSSPSPTSSSSRGFVNGSVLIDFVGEFAHASKFKLLWQDVLLLALQILMLVVGSLKTKASEEPKEPPQDLDAEEQGIRRADGEPILNENGDIEMQSLLPGTAQAEALSTTIEINVVQEIRHIMRSNQELQNRIRSGDEVALRTLLAAVATNRARQQGGTADTTTAATAGTTTTS